MHLSDSTGSALVNDCNLTQNRADGDGGAIFNINGFNSSHFTFCFAGSNGGALNNQEFGETSVFNSTFLYNSARKDGGVIFANYLCTFIESVLINNTAVNHGGVVYADQRSFLHVYSSSFHRNWANKGGVFCIKPETNLTVDSSSFNGSIKVNAGAMILAHEGTQVNLCSSNFANNSTFYGGVLTAIRNNNILIDDCMLYNNMALSGGGTIYARTGSTLKVIGSTFIENRAIDNMALCTYWTIVL